MWLLHSWIRTGLPGNFVNIIIEKETFQVDAALFQRLVDCQKRLHKSNFGASFQGTFLGDFSGVSGCHVFIAFMLLNLSSVGPRKPILLAYDFNCVGNLLVFEICRRLLRLAHVATGFNNTRKRSGQKQTAAE
jgi:hypothetical protein